MSMLEHAIKEMQVAGMYKSDSDYAGALAKDIEAAVSVIAKMGHSGASIRLFVDILGKLVTHEPISPLTGKADEWLHLEGDFYQNKRCSHVFAKGIDGSGAFDINGRVFLGECGGSYVNCSSKVPVTFPYTPATEYVKVSSIQLDPGELKHPKVFTEEECGVIETYATHLREEEIAKERRGKENL